MLRYELMRAGLLSPYELLILALINTYSKECHLKISEFVKMTGLGRTKVINTISDLCEKGLLTKRYGVHCSIHLALASEEFQLQFCGKVIHIESKSSQGGQVRVHQAASRVHQADSSVHHVNSQYRSNKELIKKGSFSSKFEEEHPGGKEVPISDTMRNKLNLILGKNILKGDS